MGTHCIGIKMMSSGKMINHCIHPDYQNFNQCTFTYATLVHNNQSVDQQ